MDGNHLLHPLYPPSPMTFPLDTSTSSTLTLPDGRKLGYAEYGSSTGQAVIYLHGLPGSRLEAASLHAFGLELGARIIAPDRPGIGWSSPHPGRTLLGFAQDVARLTEHLGLRVFNVLVGQLPQLTKKTTTLTIPGRLRRRPLRPRMRPRTPVPSPPQRLDSLRPRTPRHGDARGKLVELARLHVGLAMGAREPRGLGPGALSSRTSGS
jgi:hypothetical protein